MKKYMNHIIFKKGHSGIQWDAIVEAIDEQIQFIRVSAMWFWLACWYLDAVLDFFRFSSMHPCGLYERDKHHFNWIILYILYSISTLSHVHETVEYMTFYCFE